PAFVENLFELFLRLKVHAQRDVQSPLPGLRRVAVGVNQEERRRGRPAGVTGSAPEAAATTRRAVEELVTVCAHGVLCDAGNEDRGAAVAQAVAVQLVAGGRAIGAAAP